MTLSLLVGRISVNDIEPLLLNVCDESLNLPVVIDAFDQSQIKNRGRSGGNDIASERANVAAAYAVNVKRRLVNLLKQTPP